MTVTREEFLKIIEVIDYDIAKCYNVNTAECPEDVEELWEELRYKLFELGIELV